MAKTTLDSTTESTPSKLTFDAASGDKITLPSEGFVTDATITRDGNDLHLKSPDGETAVVIDYFSAEEPPLLLSPNGSVLTPQLVESFSSSSQSYASGNSANDESPVGAAEEVKGSATVTRADGSVEPITIGTPIYQGDVVQTDESGAVNIRFLDETSMAVSENARLSIDNYNFDPKTESGETDFSILRGVFVFTSGLIGRDDPDDVHINTPVGSIGIRGTIIAGDINPGEASTITVLEGAIVITNAQSETTLSQQFETVKILSFDKPMEEMGVLPAAEINARFESVSYVVPTLFSTIEDSAKEERGDLSLEQNSSENSPADAPAENNTDAPSAQPDNAPDQNDTLLQDQSNSDILDPELPESAEASILKSDIKALASDNHSNNSKNSVNDTAKASGSDHLAATSKSSGFGETPAFPVNTQKQEASAPPAAGNIVQNPPAALSFTLSATNVNSNAHYGTVIGELNSNASNASDVSYIFADTNSTTSANGFFQIVGSAGAYRIELTPSGATAFSSSLEPISFTSLLIRATHVNTETSDQVIPINVIDANIALDLNNAASSDVSHIKDTSNNQIGYSITALGDRNNDGFDDFAFTGNNTATRNVYIIKGSASELSDGTLNDLTSLHSRLHTEAFTDLNGSNTIVSGIGDFNGDGKKDYVIGQSDNQMSGNTTGGAAIVTNPDATGTVTFTTSNSMDMNGSGFGRSVSGIGDFNNDGYADVIIGAPESKNNSGQTFLVKGNTDLTDITTLTTNSTHTTIISGTTNSLFGTSLSGIGDFNGDGFSDFAVGAPGATGGSGQVRIYFGNKDGMITSPNHTINGMTGEYIGTSVKSLGDINGDGFSDFITKGESDIFKIIYGGASSPGQSSIDLRTSGYTITGLSSAGDFNGDGYNDFTISLADSNGTHIYVVYGKDGITNINNINFFKDPSNAFEMYYSGANSTHNLEMTSVGDINGDGFDDLAIGVPDLNGNESGNGGIIVVHGRENGTNSQNVVGTSSADVLTDGGLTGKSFRGGAGNDAFEISNSSFRKIDGGNGSDTIRFTGDGSSALDFSNFNFEDVQGIEHLNFGVNNQTIKLTVENLFNLLKTSDDGTFKIDSSVLGSNLIIDAANASGTDANAIVTAMGEMGTGASHQSITGYDKISVGGYSLYIDTDIAVSVV
jgi:hypothetical protein